MYNTHKMAADGKTVYKVKIGDNVYFVPEDKLQSVREDLAKVKKAESENPKPANKES